VMPAHPYKMPNSWQRVFAENAVCFCVGRKGASGARFQAAVTGLHRRGGV
jgi:hypothetical protein